MEDKTYRVWRKRFGDRTNTGSREQMATILFDELKIPYPFEKTRTGRYRTDVNVMEMTENQFAKNFVKMEKLKKVHNTYLKGIKREIVDGKIHPFIHLHTVRTYRPSTSNPNFANLPIRDEEQGKLVRRCFVPRKGNQFVECDFKQLEVSISACHHRDPSFIAYLMDKTKDMHKDMAQELFFLKPDEVTKQVRFYAKNQFVFPQFYGSYYVNCTPHLWESIGRYNLQTTKGKPIKEVLKEIGITDVGKCDPELEPQEGTFEYHVKKVERRFWDERFPIYRNWKKKWYERYLEKGGYRMLTGFWVEGVWSKNDVINHPIQGEAFHCLLWTLIRIMEWIKKNKMKTLVVGQIYDSIEADSPPDELQDFLGKIKETVEVDLPKAWPWLIVPLGIEAEASPIDRSWYDKEPWVCKEGIWKEQE